MVKSTGCSSRDLGSKSHEHKFVFLLICGMPSPRTGALGEGAWKQDAEVFGYSCDFLGKMMNQGHYRKRDD